ncbi:hypothetical protein [Ornithinibacillus sp. FSL M8-0202]|uniref:hypothetical protein n=1 Tax=Ornithinibacillus sp. FSL M8-0202 TaxID=2921616 RepID=UPI0030CCDEDF
MALGFYFTLWWHFLVLIMLIMLGSGLVSFTFKRFPSWIILIVSGLVGLIYSIVVDAVSLTILIVPICIVFSLIPILFAKFAVLLKEKEQQIKQKNG